MVDNVIFVAAVEGEACVCAAEYHHEAVFVNLDRRGQAIGVPFAMYGRNGSLVQHVCRRVALVVEGDNRHDEAVGTLFAIFCRLPFYFIQVSGFAEYGSHYVAFVAILSESIIAVGHTVVICYFI